MSSGPADIFSPDATDPFQHAAIALSRRFSHDAVDRDRAGGRPTEQIAWLRQAGFPAAQLPAAYGGAGQSWLNVLRAVRQFARADGSLAHLYGYHHLPLHVLRARGTEAQRDRLLRATASGNLVWSNSDNAMTRHATGQRDGDGWIVNGVRPFASGTHIADYMVTSWSDTEDRLWFAAIPLNREGITVNDDWDGIGQRQTGSGTVSFSQVRIAEDEVIGTPDQPLTPFASLTSLLQQSVLLNVFIGSAQGALDEARHYTATVSRPWLHSGVGRHVDDPWVQRQYGDLVLRTLAAAELADEAANALDAAYAQGEGLGPEQRGQLAITLATANLFAGEMGLKVTSEVFEVMGARSAMQDFGYDRFWRNVRTHTLHNPAEYKKRTIGKWLLAGEFPILSRYR